MSKIEEIEAFPLHWPLGYKRTPTGNRIRSVFKQTMEQAQKFTRRQIELLGAGGLIISSNIHTRKDGGLYTDYMSRKIDWPRLILAGPFEKAPRKIPMRGFQGFRYVYEPMW